MVWGGWTPLAKIVCNCNINKHYFHEVKGENLCQLFWNIEEREGIWIVYSITVGLAETDVVKYYSLMNYLFFGGG